MQAGGEVEVARRVANKQLGVFGPVISCLRSRQECFLDTLFRSQLKGLEAMKLVFNPEAQ